MKQILRISWYKFLLKRRFFWVFSIIDNKYWYYNFLFDYYICNEKSIENLEELADAYINHFIMSRKV